MTTKLIVLAALLGHLVFARPHVPEHSSFGQQEVDGHYEAHHAPTPYHFEYSVNDPHTNDIKSQHEESDGHGNVKGMYSLVEPDGSTRIVEYTADHEHGFVAKVKKIESAHHDDQDYHEPIKSYTPYYKY